MPHSPEANLAIFSSERGSRDENCLNGEVYQARGRPEGSSSSGRRLKNRPAVRGRGFSPRRKSSDMGRALALQLPRGFFPASFWAVSVRWVRRQDASRAAELHALLAQAAPGGSGKAGSAGRLLCRWGTTFRSLL